MILEELITKERQRDMRLVIGGTFQGKKEYAAERYGIKQGEFAEGREASFEEIFTCRGMVHFHEWIKKRLQEGTNLSGLELLLEQKNPDVVLISNELGCGVVPVDAFDREYRELTGRVCTRIAAKSEEVVRVFCGIGTVIKHD